MVAKKTLEEIGPRYGLPVTMGSDNGPAFVSQIVQGLVQALWTKWKLHCEYNPQSSGQVEGMNQTLKETLTKLTIETGGDWVTLFPFALFRVRNTPYKIYMKDPLLCVLYSRENAYHPLPWDNSSKH